MKIYLIKHKGKTHQLNFFRDVDTVTIGTAMFYSGRYFYRRKDALLYLKNLSNNEFLEVIYGELENSKQDNRKL